MKRERRGAAAVPDRQEPAAEPEGNDRRTRILLRARRSDWMGAGREGGEAMKLLLSSCSIVQSPRLIDALKALLPPGPRRICHIITAGLAGRPVTDRSWAAEPWVTEEERRLQGHGFACESLDVADWPGSDLAGHLAGFDVLYVQGGNTFYLLDRMRRSGADGIIHKLVAAHGMVYCGVSAGSIIAGPDIGSPAGARTGTATRSG